MERKLVIEIDGSQHAANRYDQWRDTWLKHRGFKVLRFWNNEVLTNPAGVQYVISASLGLRWLP
jgi:primosomal protein N' (replication factor Y)